MIFKNFLKKKIQLTFGQPTLIIGPPSPEKNQTTHHQPSPLGSPVHPNAAFAVHPHVSCPVAEHPGCRFPPVFFVWGGGGQICGKKNGGVGMSCFAMLVLFVLRTQINFSLFHFRNFRLVKPLSTHENVVIQTFSGPKKRKKKKQCEMLSTQLEMMIFPWVFCVGHQNLRDFLVKHGVSFAGLHQRGLEFQKAKTIFCIPSWRPLN